MSAQLRTLAEAAAARAAGMKQRSHRPKERRSSPEPGAGRNRVVGSGVAFRAPVADVEDGADGGDVQETAGLRIVERNGLQCVPVGGYAYKSETGYEMYDWYGPYTEVVTAGASSKTLAAGPRVEYVLNHNRSGGAPMALTENDMLVLVEDEIGLDYTAYVDPTRSDVADMLKAIERRDLTQASFKFWITAGQWSPDYTEFRINEIDLDGGDVSSVNFGANPAATTGFRSAGRGDVPAAPAVDLERIRARARAAAAL